jgi:amino acid transporter
MQNLKKIIIIIILIVFIIFNNRIDFGIKKGYFQSDIDFFQTCDVYSIYAACIFVFISFLYLYLKNRNEPKSKDPNIISPEFLKFTPLIICIAFVIYSDFDKTVTNCSLIINKQKQISSVEKKFKNIFL